MKKVLITSPVFGKYSSEPENILKAAGCEIIRVFEPTDEIVNMIDNVDGIIVGLAQITAELISKAKKLKVIAKHGVGVDNIDINAATKRKIFVTNAPGGNQDAVADLTFGLLIAAARQIPLADSSVRKGQWPRLIGKSVFGKTLGILGLGAIGKAVAQRAVGFNMNILAFDLADPTELEVKMGIKRVTIEELFSSADYISIHLPLTDQTRGLVDKRLLRLMKEDAVLINASRGGIVDEQDLYERLAAKKIFAASLDVFTHEPLQESPFLKLENVILTPHIAAFTKESLTSVSLTNALDIKRVLDGGKPLFWVNKEEYDE